MQYSIKHIIKYFYLHNNSIQTYRFLWICVLNVIMGFFEIGIAGGISFLGVAMSSPDSLKNIPFLYDVAYALNIFQNVPDSLAMLFVILAAICCATVVKNCLLAYVTLLQNYFAQLVAWNTGEMLFRRFLCAPYLWHAHQNSSELITILNWKALIASFVVACLTFVTQLVIALFLFGGALIANPKASSILFISIIILGLLLQKYSRKKLYAWSKNLTDYDLFISKTSLQGLQGIAEVIIYDRKKTLLNEYTKNIQGYSKTFSLQAMFPSIPQWSLESAGMLLMLTVLLYLIMQGASVAETTGLITLLAAISWRLLPAANKSISAVMTMRSHQPYVEKILNALNATQETTSIEFKKVLPFNESIELNNISFKYPAAERLALNQLSLKVSKGKCVGFVGLSGSGKSTLSSLIIGLVAPDSGTLSVDGKPWDPTSSRLKIGYVPQHIYLTDASLAENVAFSHWGEAIDEERVLRCCQMAAINFLDDLPDGIHTILGERGVRLSGGQLQRVGIARALYDDPELLIFDEATSALDHAAEAEVQSTIATLRSSVTQLIIAHRLSTVLECDEVYWINKGEVVLHGVPDEVLKQYEEYLQHSHEG